MRHTGRRDCGAVHYEVDGPFAHVTLGTSEGDHGIRPRAHIFVGSKAPWFEITDGLPEFVKFPK